MPHTADQIFAQTFAVRNFQALAIFGRDPAECIAVLAFRVIMDHLYEEYLSYFDDRWTCERFAGSAQHSSADGL